MAEKLVSKKSDIKRIRTYIEGLDENMEGGIPVGHVTLISGAAGTMKSSVAFNILYNEAINYNKIGLYISLEQSYSSLINHFISMGYDFTKVNLAIIRDLADLKGELLKIKASKRGTIIITDIGAIRKEIKDIKMAANAGWLNVIKNVVRKVKEDAGCDMFVLDSLSALYVLSKFENPRIELFYIFEFLRDAEITSFLISEMSIDGTHYSEYGVEDYLSDGILHINLSKFRRTVVREVSIVKMRTTNCNHDVFSLEYKNGKFTALYGGQTPLL